ncbi:hypothetical protein NDK50_07810 [Paraburkholderia bryophila]|uniref:hypothetical protein n=1 Tax=Paraburkholderia bryophila TaxID=420952 RepID=UPI00234B1E53|nr:hypothetical protein [Paraburkholderia bryophila]WCM21341.1 hypothetical protein NDK50_07810 [Paraburkholderia bryophila]
MNSNPLITSGLTIGAADLVPTVNWALEGFHGTAPSNLSALIAGGIVLVLHAGYNWLASRPAAKQPVTPAQ